MLKVLLYSLNDFHKIIRIMSDPILFEASMTDEDIELNNQGRWMLDTNIHYLGLEKDGECIGIVRFSQLTSITIDYHWHLLPQYWGTSLSDEFVKLVDEWFKENTSIHKVVIQSPQVCTHVYKAAIRNGFSVEGVLTGGILWRGKVQDLILMSRFIKRI